MPRGARQFSTSGYMHLIIRGNGKQILFEDWEDHHFFLSILEKYCMETEVKILAYCLMDNHVHLLVHDQDNNSSRMMQRDCAIYLRSRSMALRRRKSYTGSLHDSCWGSLRM